MALTVSSEKRMNQQLINIETNNVLKMTDGGGMPLVENLLSLAFNPSLAFIANRLTD